MNYDRWGKNNAKPGGWWLMFNSSVSACGAQGNRVTG